MTDTINIPAGKTPGIGLFCAILNFIWAAMLFVGAFGTGLAIVVGSVAGFYNTIHDRMARMGSDVVLTMSANALVGMLFMLCLLGGLVFLMTGIGLVRGKRYAFFMQIVLSVLGLFGFPIWTIINLAVIYAFFRPNVREFYKV